MQGPEERLEGLGIALPSAVDPARPARIAPATRTVVNGHFFWVASAEELQTFRADPQRFTGPLLDPVDHAWFTPDADSPRREVAGEILLFASADSAARFDAAGGHYAGHAHGPGSASGSD